MSIEVFLLLPRDFKIVFHIRKIHSFFFFREIWTQSLFIRFHDVIDSLTGIEIILVVEFRIFVIFVCSHQFTQLALRNYCSRIKMIFQYQLFSIFSLQKKRQFLKINLTWSNIKEIYGRMNGFVRYGLLIYNLISFQPSFHNNF